MATYKIKNITNLIGKRDSKFNTAVDIEYIDDRTKKVINLKAGDEVFLTVNSLPLSVHRLRIKKLIDISEVSAAELANSMQKTKPVETTKKLQLSKKVVVVEKKEHESTVTKKSAATKRKAVEE